MAFASTFAAELNSLAGDTVEIAYDNKLLEAVISSAAGNVVTVIPTGTYYTPGAATFIAISSIDFVQVLT